MYPSLGASVGKAPHNTDTHLVPGEDDDDTDPDHGDAGDEEDDHNDGQVHDVPQLPGRPVHGVHLHCLLLPLLLRLHVCSLDLGERVVNLEVYFFLFWEQ